MSLKEILHHSGTRIIDVREPFEFAEDHIPGALNIPLNSIPAHAEDIRNFKSPVVLYCRSGNRSGMALRTLSGLGITELYNGGGLFDMKALMN
jgi:phage shock protein E